MTAPSPKPAPNTPSSQSPDRTEPALNPGEDSTAIAEAASAALAESDSQESLTPECQTSNPDSKIASSEGIPSEGASSESTSSNAAFATAETARFENLSEAPDEAATSSTDAPVAETIPGSTSHEATTPESNGATAPEPGAKSPKAVDAASNASTDSSHNDGPAALETSTATAPQASFVSPTIRRMTEATERAFKRGASGPRSPAEDQLVAAVMFVADSIALGLGEQPISPWTEVGRVPLIQRAFAALRSAGIESLWVSAAPALHDRIRSLGQLEQLELRFFQDFADMKLPEHGRVLILDPCALHDVTSIQRILKWRGGRIAMAVADEGDGLRVQIEGIRIREIGRDLVPFDALTAGAVSIPMELLEHFTEGSMLTVLRELADADLLGASLVPKSRSRELHLKRSLPEQENQILSSLVARTDGLIDRLVNRKLSRAITASLVSSRLSPWLIQLMSLLVGLSAAPLLALTSKVTIAPITAGAMLWGSLLLERVAWELATLRLSLSASLFGFMKLTSALVTLAICLGLNLWFGTDTLLLVWSALLVVAKGIGSFLSLRRWSKSTPKPEPSWADRVDGLLHNRNELFLITPALLSLAILSISASDLAKTLVGVGLAVSALVVGALSLVLLTLSSRPSLDE